MDKLFYNYLLSIALAICAGFPYGKAMQRSEAPPLQKAVLLYGSPSWEQGEYFNDIYRYLDKKLSDACAKSIRVDGKTYKTPPMSFVSESSRLTSVSIKNPISLGQEVDRICTVLVNLFNGGCQELHIFTHDIGYLVLALASQVVERVNMIIMADEERYCRPVDDRLVRLHRKPYPQGYCDGSSGILTFKVENYSLRRGPTIHVVRHYARPKTREMVDGERDDDDNKDILLAEGSVYHTIMSPSKNALHSSLCSDRSISSAAVNLLRKNSIMIHMFGDLPQQLEEMRFAACLQTFSIMHYPLQKNHYDELLATHRAPILSMSQKEEASGYCCCGDCSEEDKAFILSCVKVALQVVLTLAIAAI